MIYNRHSNLALQTKVEVRTLGVILDWTFKPHINNISKTNIAQVKPYAENKKTVQNAAARILTHARK